MKEGKSEGRMNERKEPGHIIVPDQPFLSRYPESTATWRRLEDRAI